MVTYSALDLRYALRSLRSSRASSSAAILSLALAIGLTTAAFSFVNAVLLRPFPFSDAERLVTIWGSRAFDVRPGISGHQLERWRTSTNTVEDVAVFQLNPTRFSLGRDDSDSVIGAAVGDRVFSVLQSRPLIGRVFSSDDNTDDAQVILSYGLWRGRFNGNPGIIGQSVLLNELSHTVIGVMRQYLIFPDLDMG